MPHAFLSPSGAPYWMLCEAKPRMEEGLPDRSGRDAGEGTAAHALRAMCLTEGTDAQAYLGRILEGFEVTDEMASAVQRSVDVIRQFGGEVMVEVSLDISHITGEEGASGTADTVIVLADKRLMIVDDYKHGRGVPVYAEENEQLVIYAAAALAEVELVHDIEFVTMRISQPRINNDSEWTITVAELRERVQRISEQAAVILSTPVEYLEKKPGEKQCRFCKAKATCPALRDEVTSAVFHTTAASPDDFDNYSATTDAKHSDDQWLAAAMAKADLVESWVKAVRAEVERRLLAGDNVPGFKLVEGRRGARKWANEAEAEATLKAMRLKHDEMYDYSIISPTSAEKLAKAEKIGPRQWPKLQSLIVQVDGKPSVAPASDKRPALTVTPVADEFSDETAEGLV